jgi:DNA repair protein RecN (Recombination protein N)
MVVEDRLAALERLVRRHGGLAEARQAAEAAKRDLVRLETGDEGLLLLEELRGALLELAGAADRLSADRTRAARRLSRAVAAELRVLGFPGGAFEARLAPIEPRHEPADTSLGEETMAAAGLIPLAKGTLSPLEGRPALEELTAPGLVAYADWLLERVGEEGREHVRFLIAPNPGEGFNPLGRTAAGGELARIMLALRTALSGAGGGQVLIFDEVDSGVGGVVLDAVGDRLARLAEGRQVLSVTHQARIAARAHLHLRVDKETRGGRTVTRLVALDRAARRTELERLLAGRRPGPRAAALADELLERHAPKPTATSGRRRRGRPGSRAGTSATSSPLSDSSSG